MPFLQIAGDRQTGRTTLLAQAIAGYLNTNLLGQVTVFTPTRHENRILMEYLPMYLKKTSDIKRVNFTSGKISDNSNRGLDFRNHAVYIDNFDYLGLETQRFFKELESRITIVVPENWAGVPEEGKDDNLPAL